jgi:hypothetical protein
MDINKIKRDCFIRGEWGEFLKRHWQRLSGDIISEQGDRAPNIEKSNLKDVAEMGELLKRNWQHVGDDKWISPASNQRHTRAEALLRLSTRPLLQPVKRS